MKRLFLYIVTLLMISSCSLNLEPKNSVTYTNYFKSEADIEALVITMMAKQRDIYAPVDGTARDIVSIECDNEDVALDFNPYENLAVGFKTLDPSYYLGKDQQHFFNWQILYDVIYIANVIIENEYRFQNVKPERAQFWIQQANFFKAQMFFELARNWGDAPIPAGTESLIKKGKSPQIDVLKEAIRCAMIATDLPKHESLIGSNNTKLNLRQYPSKGTTYTLLANIYAYMGGVYNKNEYWVEAEKYASEVIEDRAGHYALEPTITDLCKNCLGKSRSSEETIFSITMSSKDHNYANLTVVRNLYPLLRMVTAPLQGNFTDVFGTRFFRYVQTRIKTSAVEALYNEAGDQRKDEYWYTLTAEELDALGVEPIYAYPNKLKESDILYNTNVDFGGATYLGLDVDRVIWRLADVILLRAECRARLGLSTAVDDLNKVRSRAGLGAYSGGGDLRAEIYKERKRELFGEGHRFFDAIRNGYYSDLGPDFANLSPTDIERGALYYPITKEAFKDNDLMRQNTYWLWKQ